MLLVVSWKAIEATLTLEPAKNACYSAWDNVTLKAVYNGPLKSISQIKWQHNGTTLEVFAIDVLDCQPVQYQAVFPNMTFRCPSTDQQLSDNTFELTFVTDDQPIQSWGVLVTFKNHFEEVSPKPLLHKCLSQNNTTGESYETSHGTSDGTSHGTSDGTTHGTVTGSSNTTLADSVLAVIITLSVIVIVAPVLVLVIRCIKQRNEQIARNMFEGKRKYVPNGGCPETKQLNPEDKNYTDIA